MLFQWSKNADVETGSGLHYKLRWRSHAYIILRNHTHTLYFQGSTFTNKVFPPRKVPSAKCCEGPDDESRTAVLSECRAWRCCTYTPCGQHDLHHSIQSFWSKTGDESQWPVGAAKHWGREESSEYVRCEHASRSRKEVNGKTWAHWVNWDVCSTVEQNRTFEDFCAFFPFDVKTWKDRISFFTLVSVGSDSYCGDTRGL